MSLLFAATYPERTSALILFGAFAPRDRPGPASPWTLRQGPRALEEAGRRLSDACQTFGSAQSRFEVARTHLDLAVLAHALGNRQDVATHLTEAHSLFTTLRVPKYVDRTGQLAREFGFRLGEDPAR